MWLNTEETLQAAATFIIYHKNKDTRLLIILCKLETFCFLFIKKMVGNTLYFYNNHIYSLLHALSDDWSGPRRRRRRGDSIVWSIRAWRLIWTNKVHLVRFLSGNDVHNTSIDISVQYRQLFTRYEKCHSLLNSKDHFDVNKTAELCKWLDTGIFWCLGYAFEYNNINFYFHWKKE